ncbi:SGNH/GDSL hydrolase family protein [Pedobacter petrophilus]|uniref:SGNH/GDSL hydrolase family protein n=1 Tax=Pedobacter petrophilus TaxID=1908241 RepID=A0A7K0G3F3_9SPHI|nr:SGNH/GDSL hydrolase family protein [Pedobacter petrophilus]MRX77516.1 SGNH/GDSL hydrolase family protein [Pedobacter petrophilus]
MPAIETIPPVTSSLQARNISYLALGDSYTIGEAVTQQESFPFQLQKLLKEKSIAVASPKIMATTGWTTDELQNAIKQASLTTKYDFVTLLIGVNNQYRDYPIDTYKKEFAALLQTAIDFANGRKDRVFVVSIPDWGATPFAKSSPKSQEAIAAEIDSFNAANRDITITTGVSYTDITSASRNAVTDLTLIAPDGLHPSGKMYADWALELLPKVLNALTQ